jgi:hypothetical protein
MSSSQNLGRSWADSSIAHAVDQSGLCRTAGITGAPGPSFAAHRLARAGGPWAQSQNRGFGGGGVQLCGPLSPNPSNRPWVRRQRPAKLHPPTTPKTPLLTLARARPLASRVGEGREALVALRGRGDAGIARAYVN